MDKYIGDMIEEQRHDTRNGDTSAHDDSHILRYNVYAQKDLFGAITHAHNWVFEETIITPLVTNQSDYEVNDNLSFGTRITNVEYRMSGSSRFYPLQVTPDRYRQLAYTGRPRFYRRRHGTVVIEPTPQGEQGDLRITYERALDTLALRSDTINGAPSGTSITLTDPSAAEELKYNPSQFVCVSDFHGNVLLYNGVIGSYDSGTNVITLAEDVSNYLTEGTTLADLNGTSLTVGKYTTTHSKLPNEAEGYFNEWVSRKLNSVDSSEQFSDSDDILVELRKTIVKSFKMPDKARKVFPVSDFDLLIPGVE